MDGFTILLYSFLLHRFIDKGKIFKVKPGDTLFEEFEQVKNIYLLLEGSMALGRTQKKGKEFTLKILDDEEVLIEYQLFKESPRYHFHAKAITECKFLQINKDDFEEFILGNLQAMSLLTKWLSTRYIKSQLRCQDLMINGKKGGLYSILIRLASRYGKRVKEGILIDLSLTHQEIANLTYGTREVIQRMLKELREEEIILYDGQKIIIKDLSYLKRETDCQNCPSEICGVN
ncbi:Crp/Fnr family transcriptional regulator [Bacillus sp. ISL-47]|uniref:Crp/Fnr family transcriptional regulator n=1 Tax=Bacillus sp. ISL-47 TaxID=2819130 RepID=UPI001BEBFDA0|nr:Crp/Fnr family transcriptional regulator [Bacillus sp. ISL-47]MBT2687116.1 Crp/Fnr family transcriptional regulator [Bacillus sp. ISL-47]MBT2710466.1 Crp/Fnr family transcriptional regulator [Pseudomonas sp. ISL-84]